MSDCGGGDGGGGDWGGGWGWGGSGDGGGGDDGPSAVENFADNIFGFFAGDGSVRSDDSSRSSNYHRERSKRRAKKLEVFLLMLLLFAVGGALIALPAMGMLAPVAILGGATITLVSCCLLCTLHPNAGRWGCEAEWIVPKGNPVEIDDMTPPDEEMENPTERTSVPVTVNNCVVENDKGLKTENDIEQSNNAAVTGKTLVEELEEEFDLSEGIEVKV